MDESVPTTAAEGAEARLVPYQPSPVPDARAVLVLAPHPDDEVFGCGGALALHGAAGTSVHVVVLTGGDAGGEALARRVESEAAARVLGYAPPQFWDLPDRGLAYGEALVARIAQALQDSGAQLLYAPSLWENHPDHRATALAALEAARREGCTLAAYEIGAPLRPNRLVDITPVMDAKRAAMACFGSQMARHAYDRYVEGLNTFRAYTLEPQVRWAEAFELYDAQALRAGEQPFLQSEYQRQRAQGLLRLAQDAPLVSVLVRSLDRPELSRALDSVAAQTWPRVEVVVVDAKGQGHRALPAWCGGFPMRLVAGSGPLHRSEAANRAIDHARGDFCVFLDDDDYLAPDHVQRLAQALAGRRDAVAAVTGARAVRPDGSLIYEWQGRFAPHRQILFNQMPIMTVLFRRSAVGPEGARFDLGLDLFEDWDFWMQLSLRGPFVEVPGSSASYVVQVQAGSGVNEPEQARRALAPVREKWRQRWPDEWLDGLRADFDRIAPLEAELHAKTERLAPLEAELARLRHELQVQQQARTVAEQHNATMEHHRNVAEHHRHLADQQRATAEHERNVADQQRATAEHERNVAEQQRVIAEHERTVADQQRATAEHERNVAEQQRVIAEHGRTVADQQRATAEHERNVAEQQRAIAEHERGLTEQRWLLAQQQADETARLLAEAQAALHAARQELQAVLGSRSWRMTAGLRQLGKGARGLLR